MVSTGYRYSLKNHSTITEPRNNIILFILMRHKNRRCAAAPLDGATAAVAFSGAPPTKSPNTKEMCNKEVGYTLLLGSQYCSVNFLCRFLAMHRDVIFQKYVLQYSNSTGRKSG
jgi:hypothetical protein